MLKIPTFRSLVVPKEYEGLYPTFDQIRQYFTGVANSINNPDFGPTTARPTMQLTMGQSFYDTTLNKPIWWNTTTATWKDATGANV